MSNKPNKPKKETKKDLKRKISIYKDTLEVCKIKNKESADFDKDIEFFTRKLKSFRERLKILKGGKNIQKRR